MNDDKPGPPIRFQVILGADTVRAIDRLKDRIDYSSRADVIRSAVRVLDLGLSEGKELWIKDKDGGEYRIIVV